MKKFIFVLAFLLTISTVFSQRLGWSVDKPPGLTEVQDRTFDAIIAERDACCEGVPTSYQSPLVSQAQAPAVRPVAQQVNPPCKQPNLETNYVRDVLQHTQEITVNDTIFYVKIAAVPERSEAGGMPAGSFTAIKLGNYTASQGYIGVFVGKFFTRSDVNKARDKLTTDGWCSSTVVILPIAYRVTIPLYTEQGNYVMRN